MDDQVVLITGASGGLCEAVVRAFADAGARLALVGRRLEALQSQAAGLALPPARVACHAADLARPGQAREAVNAVLADWGRVDCLINLVGTWAGGVKLAELNDDQWREILDTNLHSAFHISRAVLPPMLAQGGGRIVHVGARAVERPGSGQAAYNVAKAGLLALTRSISADYGTQGIRANIILPGTIATERQRHNKTAAEMRYWVSPQDIAQMMLFLCGPAGGALNGAAIPVYGGRTL
ncbi:MAG: SDR family NAD(P)-dependent oxidoreductase [Anaerolineae bacterium]